MDLTNPYIVVIDVCFILILSYLFNWIGKKFHIPSVLLLILLGIGIKYALDYGGIQTGDSLMHLLQIVGIIGLIMIILEAALDLELKKEKMPEIFKALFLALFSLGGSIAVTTYLLHTLLIPNLFSATLYGVALSVVSSAIVIPSVSGFSRKNKEFLIYESTFSDIFGIMIFFNLLANVDKTSVSQIVFDVALNLGLTLVMSVFIGYLMVILLNKLRSQLKLFLLVSLLVLLYSVGKLLHFSSLILILIFGLILNNSTVFFRGKLSQFIDNAALKSLQKDFHILIMESAFLVRTYFFVIFGMTLDLENMLNENAVIISLAIITGIYMIRLITLKIFAVKRLFPEVFVSPRGLITILLFFSIPIEYQSGQFNTGILLYVILITSLLMAISLVINGKDIDFSEFIRLNPREQNDKTNNPN